MNPLLISAASGMKARMESLDMLANNIANAGTVGFKADREFYGAFEAGLYQTHSDAPPADAPVGQMPANSIQRNGVAAQLPLIEKHWTDFSQGMLLPTGNPLDLALDGDGFFALNAPSASSNTNAAGKPAVLSQNETAPDQNGAAPNPAPNSGAATAPNIVYSRSGRFQISRSNQLATAEGFTLRNALDQGRPITVDPAVSIDIAGDGTVSQEGRIVGRIEIGGIPDPGQTLSKMGSSYFARMTPGATSDVASATKLAAVKQGMLEQSNVGATDASVRLVGVMRQFEMMQRAMALGTEMDKRALDEVARFS